jgi:histidinol-phosphate aminotransferase
MTETVVDPRGLLRSAVTALGPRSAAEDVDARAERLGIPPERVVRLHLNENPYGAPLRVQEVLASCEEYHLYPDSACREIRRLLAGYTGITAERIVVGNGSGEIVDLMLSLFVDPGETVVIPTPTYGLYAARAQVFGARVAAVPRQADFSLDIEAMEAAITRETKLIFLASPNNPTGNLCRERDIVRLLRRNVIVVVDEAYFEYSGRTVAHLTREYDNLVVLRTFSKWAGLAGLRVGYGLCPRWIADEAARVQRPYPVNVAAQVAVRAIFEEMPQLRNTIRRIRLERLRMFRALRKLNFVRPLESKGNFLLVHVRYGTGAALADWLAEDGIFVRRFSAPDLSDYVRISVGKPEDTDRLVRRMTALAQRYAREV